jgi:hypothetical protein
MQTRISGSILIKKAISLSKVVSIVKRKMISIE